MKAPDITTLLNMSESDSLDFKVAQYKFTKPATDEEKAELLKDIIAFANAFKTGDAFIIIGVSERNQRKDQVVGIATHLKDNEVQQFVQSKTNRRVEFLVHSTTAEGQPIDIIQIAHKQERPISLTKSFGKLKANEAWIRVGSSSAIATPDQIAAMVKADINANLAEARLALEWADPDTQKRLGQAASITSTRLVEPPPPLSELLDQPSSTTRRRTTTDFGFLMDNGPSFEERKKYAQARAFFSPVRIWLKNLGARNASNVNVKIRIRKTNGLIVSDPQSLPKKPRGRWDIMPLVRNEMQWDTHVGTDENDWIIEINAKTIQPQDEFWSADKIFFAAGSDLKLEASATVFADDLAKPIEIPLEIYMKVVERRIQVADLEFDHGR